MIQAVHFHHGSFFFNKSSSLSLNFTSLKNQLRKSSLHAGVRTANKKKSICITVLYSTPVSELVGQAEVAALVQTDAFCDNGHCMHFPHVQSLKNLSKKDLFMKVVMVRFDATILLPTIKEQHPSPANAFFTIKYLHRAGAKVILVSSWNVNVNSRSSSGEYFSHESVAEFLSSMLKVKVVPMKFHPGNMQSDVQESENSVILLLENLSHFKGERANCRKFAKQLASGVDIFVNDAFSESHRVLASTVGVTSYCYACVTGFYFEEGLYKLKKVIKITERPSVASVAIIGGGNLSEKAAALRFLASTCDGLIFVGSIAFQILHALGIRIPKKLVDLEALGHASGIVELAKSRNIPLVLPKDIWCIKNHSPEQMEILSVHSIHEGWHPVDIGPGSLVEMINFLLRCKKVMWIGPLGFTSSIQDEGETIKLAKTLATLSGCDITFVGKVAFEDLLGKSNSLKNVNVLKSAAVVWEVLKGRKLPGLVALDRAYPLLVDWSVAFDDPMRPLVVDVGSGNGLFLFEMARRKQEMNFLGLEMNARLVDRCINDVHRLGIYNAHFIHANATSTFRPIVSSYPGELVLVSIQCPNPDFNKPENRWRMLQKSLIEAIADLLMLGGKVFLQSDIEAVASRMKNEFLEHCNGKLVISENFEDSATNESGWLDENPFDVQSDWERHVLDSGGTMYRLLLSKVKNGCQNQ